MSCDELQAAVAHTMTLHQMLDEVQKLNHELLRRDKQLELADELASAWLAYVKRFAKCGPWDCDMEATKLIDAHKRYTEARGIKP